MDKNVYKMDFVGNETSPFAEDYPNIDWIMAGIKILREQGPQQVSIENLCEILGKTEQDFNSRFNGCESFLHTLLDYWYEKETLVYIDMLEEIGGNAEENLIAMVEIVHNADKADEIAIRNLALLCPNARDALAKVDRTRVDVSAGLFKEMGFSEKDAKARAKIFYTSIIGTEYTTVSSSLDQKYTMCDLLMRRD